MFLYTLMQYRLSQSSLSKYKNGLMFVSYGYLWLCVHKYLCLFCYLITITMETILSSLSSNSQVIFCAHYLFSISSTTLVHMKWAIYLRYIYLCYTNYHIRYSYSPFYQKQASKLPHTFCLWNRCTEIVSRNNGRQSSSPNAPLLSSHLPLSSPNWHNRSRLYSFCN